MAFANLSFETAGTGLGQADSWTWTRQASARIIAGYGTVEVSWETFEAEWHTNESYLFAFAGFNTDLTQAEYPTNGPTGEKTAEDFEEFWHSNESYRFGQLDDGIVASYDTSTPQNFEDFEQEWHSNQSYAFAFAGIGTDLTAAVYNGDGFFSFNNEPFDSGWEHNGDQYLYAFVGIGTDLTAASYDTGSPEPVEDFEEEWTGFVMTSI